LHSAGRNKKGYQLSTSREIDAKKIAFTEQAIELRGLFFLGQKGKINKSGKSHHTSSKQDRL